VPTTQVRLGPLAFAGPQAFLGVRLVDLLSPPPPPAGARSAGSRRGDGAFPP